MSFKSKCANILRHHFLKSMVDFWRENGLEGQLNNYARVERGADGKGGVKEDSHWASYGPLRFLLTI